MAGSVVTNYLKIDSTRVSFGEYWRWKQSPAFLILAVCKLLKVRLGTTLLAPAVATVDEVAPGGQPPELVAALQPAIRSCLEKGYAISFWYTVPTLGSIQGLAVALTSADDLSAALAMAGQSRDGLQREVHLSLVSRLLGGKLLGTSQHRSLFDPAPKIEPLVLRGQPYAALLDAHAARVNSRGAEVDPVGDMRELVRELEQLQIDTNLARGVYVPASPEDVAKVMRSQMPQTPTW